MPINLAVTDAELDREIHRLTTRLSVLKGEQAKRNLAQAIAALPFAVGDLVTNDRHVYRVIAFASAHFLDGVDLTVEQRLSTGRFGSPKRIPWYRVERLKRVKV